MMADTHQQETLFQILLLVYYSTEERRGKLKKDSKLPLPNQIKHPLNKSLLIFRELHLGILTGLH